VLTVRHRSAEGVLDFISFGGENGCLFQEQPRCGGECQARFGQGDIVWRTWQFLSE
jgi:hypothetical protein